VHCHWGYPVVANNSDSPPSLHWHRIYFEGVFRATEMFLNGELVGVHAGHFGDAHGERGGAGMGGGYTSFSVRIDNASSVRYGDTEPNVLAVYVDPREGSECHATLFAALFCCPFVAALFESRFTALIL
jgi:hypothetical protein